VAAVSFIITIISGGWFIAPKAVAAARRLAPDMNLIMTGGGRLVEIQGTAEGEAFTEKELATLLDLGKGGIKKLVALQKRTLGLRSLPATWT